MTGTKLAVESLFPAVKMAADGVRLVHERPRLSRVGACGCGWRMAGSRPRDWGRCRLSGLKLAYHRLEGTFGSVPSLDSPPHCFLIRLWASTGAHPPTILPAWIQGD